MDFFVPYDQLGVATPGPWQNASPAAGTRGSILNALVFPAIQNEILNVQDAAGLTRNAADFTQLLQAIKFLIPKYAPGVTSQGGLALDANNNLLLALIKNLTADTRAAPVAADVLPLGRAADGAMVSVSASGLAAYVASLFQQQTTFTQITATNSVGLSINGGDVAIPQGVSTVVPLQSISVNAAFGSVGNGVLTVMKAGYYIFIASGAVFLSSSHAQDTATLRMTLNLSRNGASYGGAPSGGIVPCPAGGGQAAANLVLPQIQYLEAGDQISLLAYAANQYGDAQNVGVSGYTNMLVALLNS